LLQILGENQDRKEMLALRVKKNIRKMGKMGFHMDVIRRHKK